MRSTLEFLENAMAYVNGAVDEPPTREQNPGTLRWRPS
jgi:hypothetical protein